MGVKVKPEQLLKRQPKTAGEIFRSVGVKEKLPVADQIQFNPEHTPFKFQVSALRQILKHTRYGLYDETGVGKTLPAQLLILLSACLGNKSVVIMPPNLIEQFTESFEATFEGVADHFKVEAMPTGPANRQAATKRWTAEGWPDVMLLSYQMFIKVWQTLKAQDYNTVVADEAHALKNPGTKTHAAFQRLIGKFGESYVLLMTGTPAHNELIDLYGLIRITAPEYYGSKRAFQYAHCEYMQIGDYKILAGYINRQMLSANLYKRGRRIRKEKVYDLEAPAVQEVPVKLASAHKKLYDRLVKNRVLEIGKEIIDATNASSLRQKSLQMVLNPGQFTDQKIPNRVLDTIDDLLGTIDTKHDKCVIVANFQKSVRLLADRYKDLNPALAYGKSDSQKARKRFLEDGSCRLMIIHPKSGGAGFNLQSVCRYVIFAEPCSIPGDFKQCLDRVHRPGQDKHVTCYIIKALGTIAPTLTRDMLAKEHEAKRITRDKSSVMDELLGEVVEHSKAA